MTVKNNSADSSMKEQPSKTQASVVCEVMHNGYISNTIFSLSVLWFGPPPKAGQFFMLKPPHSSFFLARPISVALWDSMTNILQFLIEIRGKGTQELSNMEGWDYIELTGPLGNAWTDFLPKPQKSQKEKPIALVGGGLGIAPLKALVAEAPDYRFDFYCGFKTGFEGADVRSEMLGRTFDICDKQVIATEDGSEGRKGLILDFFEPHNYAAVCACGPAAMLKATAAKCRAVNVHCFVSMEARMACGVGACLGCTIETASGNRRCCADGPIFRAQDVFFDKETSHE